MLMGHWRLTVGIVAGILWNVASLWCLTRMLGAWLGPQPSRRRAIGWLLIKFPLLYLGAYVLLRHAVSPIGFSIGFSLALIGALAWFVACAQRPHVHGR